MGLGISSMMDKTLVLLSETVSYTIKHEKNDLGLTSTALAIKTQPVTSAIYNINYPCSLRQKLEDLHIINHSAIAQFLVSNALDRIIESKFCGSGFVCLTL